MKLLIVESGTKAKAIEKYLGKPWKVLASFGHIQDMPAKTLGYDETTFEIQYEPLADKRATIQKLREAGEKAEEIYLAADPDREGEAIAAHLCMLFSDLKKPIHRVRFHEITKPAILEAIKAPTKICRPLVEAQETRRVLDRMAGYKVSPLLWKQLSDSKLSAGRVQSAALSVISDSARAFSVWSPEVKYSLEGSFNGLTLASGSSALSAETRHELVPLLGKKWVLQVTPSKREQKPPLPYITSTLQTDAANKLGASIKQIMGLAQELYEAGYITYMRTDSTAISEEILKKIKQRIQEQFGADYLLSADAKPKQKKSKNSQEAHECIRPTDIAVTEATSISSRAKQLYGLIWRRTMQSQMAPAVFRTYTWSATCDSYKLRSTEEFVHFAGFRILDPADREESASASATKREATLKEFKTQNVKPESLTLAPALTSSPQLYTEGSFVAKMEDLGIGRPSTYVSTLERLFQRDYIEQKQIPEREVEVEAYSATAPNKTLKTKKIRLTTTAMSRLMPTPLGIMVEGYLKEHFPFLCDPRFTSLLENDLDAITHGEKTKKEVCKILQTQLEESIRVLAKQPKIRNTVEAQAANTRNVTKDITVRKARFGPVIEIAEEPKPRFIPLTPYLSWRKMSIQSIPDKDILFLASLPIPYVFKEHEYQLSYGRYGFYLYDPIEKKNVPFSKRLWNMALSASTASNP